MLVAQAQAYINQGRLSALKKLYEPITTLQFLRNNPGQAQWLSMIWKRNVLPDPSYTAEQGIMSSLQSLIYQTVKDIVDIDTIQTVLEFDKSFNTSSNISQRVVDDLNEARISYFPYDIDPIYFRNVQYLPDDNRHKKKLLELEAECISIRCLLIEYLTDPIRAITPRDVLIRDFYKDANNKPLIERAGDMIDSMYSRINKLSEDNR